MSWLSDRTVDHLRDIAAWPDVGERYEVLGRIGRGGMGEVYRARDRELDRDVALKVLSAAFGADTIQRMIREARILARLEHPGIVPVHDVGSLSDGRVYYTMKLVRGHRLDAYVRDHPDLADPLRVFERICEAVAFAHARGVIHRDLKPANVMVGAFGEVLVMDWGVAKITGEMGSAAPRDGDAETPDERGLVTHPLSAAGVPISAIVSTSAPTVTAEPGSPSGLGTVSTTSLSISLERDPAGTHPGTVLGTPGFMAPEQAAGRLDEVNERSDVYALGVILGRLVEDVGARPAKPLKALIAKATHPEPGQRYASVEQLAADVTRYRSAQSVSAYRETIGEMIGRTLFRYRTPIILVLIYLIIRALIIVLART